MTAKNPFDQVPLVARDEIDTPLGPMTALATAKGLAALVFASDRYHPGPFDVPRVPADPHVQAARRWLQRYWAGESPALDGLSLDLHGSLFQRAVWRVLLRIPQGSTWTYGQVAAAVGHGAVPRATGTAIGRNPVAVITPCHRVIGANGSLTGYAGGLPLKERLLRHEGALLV
jgi:methylated-DNA-[protein]-cysteine S-methyltransferase